MHHDPLGSIQASLPIPSGVRVLVLNIVEPYPDELVLSTWISDPSGFVWKPNPELQMYLGVMPGEVPGG